LVPPHEVRTIAIIARVINFVIILILRVFKESGCSYTIGRDKEHTIESNRERTLYIPSCGYLGIPYTIELYMTKATIVVRTTSITLSLSLSDFVITVLFE
jgi:hypothetical protein